MMQLTGINIVAITHKYRKCYITFYKFSVTTKWNTSHTRYSGKDMNGEDILIMRGQGLERSDDILYYGNKPVCIYRSLIGKMYFARNDNGLGLERGKLTYAMAYAPRIRYSGERQQRFTDEEIEILQTKWPEYLKPDTDMLLFNDSFFEETPDVLKQIATSINI